MVVTLIIAGLLIARQAQSEKNIEGTSLQDNGKEDRRSETSTSTDESIGGSKAENLEENNRNDWNKEDLKDLVKMYAFQYELYDFNTLEGIRCLDLLWSAESGWEVGRINPHSLATGVPQALPPTKIYPNFSEMTRGWRAGKMYLLEPDAHAEIEWGVIYIQGRYITPCKAWEHFKINNWY